MNFVNTSLFVSPLTGISRSSKIQMQSSKVQNKGVSKIQFQNRRFMDKNLGRRAISTNAIEKKQDANEDFNYQYQIEQKFLNGSKEILNKDQNLSNFKVLHNNQDYEIIFQNNSVHDTKPYIFRKQSMAGNNKFKIIRCISQNNSRDNSKTKNYRTKMNGYYFENKIQRPLELSGFTNSGHHHIQRSQSDIVLPIQLEDQKQRTSQNFFSRFKNILWFRNKQQHIQKVEHTTPDIQGQYYQKTEEYYWPKQFENEKKESKISLMMKKLKNSGPLGKLMLILLLGPKASILFIAVYLKKFFATRTESQVIETTAQVVGTSAILQQAKFVMMAKIGILTGCLFGSICLYLLYKKFYNKNRLSFEDKENKLPNGKTKLASFVAAAMVNMNTSFKTPDLFYIQNYRNYKPS